MFNRSRYGWKSVILALVLALNVGMATVNWQQVGTEGLGGGARTECGSCWS